MKQRYEIIYNSHLGWIPLDEKANFKLLRPQVVRCWVQDNTPGMSLGGDPHNNLRTLWRRVQSQIRNQMCEQLLARMSNE